MRKKLVAVLLSACMIMSVTGCGNSSGDTEPAASPTVSAGQDENKVTPTEAPEKDDDGLTGKEYDPGVFLMTQENVKRLGRTKMIEDVLWCSFSATGVEFTFTGKNLSFDLIADSNYYGETHQARFSVLVDGEKVIDGFVDEKEKSVEVFNLSESETHTVRFIKLSESSDSTIGIHHVTCDTEAKIAPTEEKELFVEFIGDSITCGYGADGTLEDKYSTHNENASEAYAYKTAEKLDADYSLVSFSGYGIISGYTSGAKQESQQLPKYYDKLGNSYGTFYANGRDLSPSSVLWDFSYTPDVVVINLGTNDYSYTKKDAVKCEEYVQGYYSFLEQLRGYYPDAVIVCTLGLMGNDLYGKIEEAVYRFTSDYSDTNVYCVPLSVQSGSFGVDYHPTPSSHDKAAGEMAEAITQILDGTYTQ